MRSRERKQVSGKNAMKILYHQRKCDVQDKTSEHSDRHWCWIEERKLV